MLDIVPEVIVHTVNGTETCGCCGEAARDWSICFGTTLESVVVEGISSTIICGKRKRSSI